MYTLLFFVLFLGAAYLVVTARIQRLRLGGINIYEGPMRSGKSFLFTAMVLDALKRGRICMVNWDMKVPDEYKDKCIRYKLYSEVVQYVKQRYDQGLGGVDVFVDEGGNVFNGKRIEVLPEDHLESFTQTGKFGNVLHIATQIYKMVIVELRRLGLSGSLWSIRRFGNLSVALRRREFNPENAEFSGVSAIRLIIRPLKDLEVYKAMGTFYSIVTNGFAASKAFNTRQIVRGNVQGRR